MTMPPDMPSPSPPTVWPSVTFSDVDAGVRFLTEGLGFVVTAVHRGSSGVVEHAEARWPDGGGVMFSDRAASGPLGDFGPQAVYAVAAEAATVDAAFGRVRGLREVEVVGEVHDTDYGSHQFDVRDGDGNLWTVGTYRGA